MREWPVLSRAQWDALVGLLEEARERGLVGPGAVEPHLRHALAFATVAGRPLPRPALDLGSGAGLPGLVLAVADPDSQWALLDGRARSAEFLGEAVDRLGLAARVQVVGERAEVAARSELRGTMALVVARGVGPPAATAECAAGFLEPGGALVVSEPPGPDQARWPAAGLDQLGMSPAEILETGERLHFARITQRRPTADRFPRRTGQPFKRPLF
ncbi:MAG TPA: RsmG family class I SAM-dependent methyltransferase [Acidimicrobiales bacterium]|nr:RsmG family class I SAM-dependent methyltransferase [Acidimicrobiales bacterium]